MKIAVIGSKGMAGHVIKTYLENLNKYKVIGLARGNNKQNNIIEIDVSDIEKLEKIFSENDFDIVINCIGVLNKNAEDHPDNAVWFNSYFPHRLASFGVKYNFKLIHISTDCVFSGKEGGYTEESFKNGIGYYAQSKALGEVINQRDLTFRTSIIGPELNINGIGLFHWFMNQNDSISGFTKAYWTGVTTIELAKAIDKAIDQDLKGLYHLVNKEKISKYELLKHFNSVFKKNELNIDINSNYTVDKSLINTRDDFIYNVPSYDKMIKKMKEWMLSYPELYSHYNLD